MRQAGVIGAGALYALRHNRERLVEDHAKAQRVAEAIRQCESLRLIPDQIDTNIVIFEVDRSIGSAANFVAALESRGIRTLTVSPTRVRVVTHLDVSMDDVEAACEIICSVAEQACRLA